LKDAEITELLKARDERGAEGFLRNYAPLIRYVVSPVLNDEGGVEECLSDVAMKVWERIGQFDEAKGSFKAWVTAIARNAALNMARGEARRPQAGTLPEESDDGAQGPEIPAPAEADPAEALLRKERAAALEGALNRLGSTDRNIFYRKYYYMQSLAQIGAELGMSERAAEGRLYRIRKQLKKELGGEIDE
jgi:RNA polymerase sigma-70 factor (ECF subfamily)